MTGSLQGKIAIVTGGSRGLGKGAALGLGEAGATVYITGRTVQAGDSPWPGTIVEAAEAVTQLGGQGIPVGCDHRDDEQVEALFQRVQQEQGRLDILVNNAWTGPDGIVGVPFWELPIAAWDLQHAVGLRSHYVASIFAARMMIAQRRGLIVNVSSRGASTYLQNVPYGVGKAGVDRLTVDTAHELRPYDVAVASIWPGLTRTERVMTRTERYPMERSRSAHFTGRAIAAHASDPEILEKTGRALPVAQLAEEYGFADPEGAWLAGPGASR